MSIQNSESRNTLRSSLAALTAARAALGEAEKVAGRAAEDLNKSTRALAAFDGLDEQFAQARIEGLRKGEWKGYPAELQKQRLKRLAAKEDCEHAKHAFDLLTGQADDARTDVAIAERVLNECAAEAFCEQVADVARQLEEANRRCEFLHRVLRAACLPFSNPGWERLLPAQRTDIMANAIKGAGFPAGTLAPWRTLDVQATNATHVHHTTSEVDEVFRAYWQEFAKAIVNDCDAQPGPLPGATELFG